MSSVYQYKNDADGRNGKEAKHNWYFEADGHEFGPYRGRDITRKIRKNFVRKLDLLLKRFQVCDL